MDENHVMSTSILQFLEDFKTHMKNNTALKHEENNALLSDFRPLSKDNDRGILFESENPDNMMFENDFIHDEHVKLFDSKVSLFLTSNSSTSKRIPSKMTNSKTKKKAKSTKRISEMRILTKRSRKETKRLKCFLRKTTII